VISLFCDESNVFAEVVRSPKPGARVAVSDVIADEDMNPASKADMAAWIGCIAGVLTETECRAALAAAGLTDV
jgi:hypothetical protein